MFFSLRNRVMIASGQLFMCGPLSVEHAMPSRRWRYKVDHQNDRFFCGRSHCEFALVPYRAHGSGEEHWTVIEGGALRLDAGGNRRSSFRTFDHQSTHYRLRSANASVARLFGHLCSSAAFGPWASSRERQRNAQPGGEYWLGGFPGAGAGGGCSPEKPILYVC
jgi:hypothetical protein